jgi:predicted aldo/keto reductase-like oxidoreductase
MVGQVAFGETGLMVSRLCFGAGWFGDAPVARGARLLRRAFELGVTFWDTSDDYGTHPHVAAALRGLSRDAVVVASKTYAATAAGARRVLAKSLKELRTDRVDVMLLHAVDSVQELEAKAGALEGLVRAREAGRVRAVGVSTHSRNVLDRLLKLPEVEVVLALCNRTGYYMKDGPPEATHEMVRSLFRAGKALYGMKALDAGHVAPGKASAALGHAFGLPYFHSICVGLTTEAELAASVGAAGRRWRPLGG